MAARAARGLPGLLSAAAVAAVCTANGGYFPTEWGWAALAGLLVVICTVLVRERVELGRLDVLFVGAFTAYTAWVALSIAWSESAAQPVLEVERSLVYLAAAAGFLLVTARRDAPTLAAGVLLGVTGLCAYALATRLVPDHVGTFSSAPPYLLAEPIGYSNALGLVAAMAILLALGAVTDLRDAWARAAAAASLLVLAPTLYFSFSRGALVALVAGAAVAVALHPRRLRFSVAGAALLPAAAVAVLVASRSHALTHQGASLARASHEGHRLLAAVVVLAAVDAAIAAALRPDATVSRNVRRAYVAALALVAAAVVAAALVRVGNPVSFVNRATDAFRSSSAASSDLNQRLFTLSGHNRSDYWRVAWREYRTHPWLGSGAGSYGRFWERFRPNPYGARNAHDLYLETLAELGPVGLALLLVALGAPLVALVRARGAPLAVAAGSAYVAFLVHVTIDWDWQLTGVGLAALACAAAVVASARGVGVERRVALWPRTLVVCAAVALALFALAGQLANTAADASVRAADRGDYAAAAGDARRARRWAPWSYQPWELLGEAQLAEGNIGSARHSFREALRRDRQNWRLWYDLSLASAGQAARKAEAEARRLSPRAGELSAGSNG